MRDFSMSHSDTRTLASAAWIAFSIFPNVYRGTVPLMPNPKNGCGGVCNSLMFIDEIELCGKLAVP